MVGSKSSEDSPRVDTYSCLRCETVMTLAPPQKKS
jgi:hypothetical protein